MAPIVYQLLARDLYNKMAAAMLDRAILTAPIWCRRDQQLFVSHPKDWQCGLTKIAFRRFETARGIEPSSSCFQMYCRNTMLLYFADSADGMFWIWCLSKLTLNCDGSCLYRCLLDVIQYTITNTQMTPGGSSKNQPIQLNTTKLETAMSHWCWHYISLSKCIHAQYH